MFSLILGMLIQKKIRKHVPFPFLKFKIGRMHLLDIFFKHIILFTTKKNDTSPQVLAKKKQKN